MLASEASAAAAAAGGVVKPTIPTSEQQQQQRSDWILEYDRHTGHFYYFNTRTGESRWAEEVEAEEFEEGVIAVDGAGAIVGREEAADDDDEAGAHVVMLGGGGGGGAATGRRQADGSEEEEEDAQDRQGRGELLAFTAMFLFHGCCVEGPLAVLEATLRAPFYLLGGLWLGLLSLCLGTEARRRAGLWLREGCLLLAAALSLLLPGLALVIYRRYHPDAEEWELTGIPTLLGQVDPRRFYTFTHGQGSLAGNVHYDDEMGSMDSLGHSILHPPKRIVISRAFDEIRPHDDSYDDEDEEEQADIQAAADGAVLWKKQEAMALAATAASSSLTSPKQQQQQQQQHKYANVSSNASCCSVDSGAGAMACRGHEEMKGGETAPRAAGGRGAYQKL